MSRTGIRGHQLKAAHALAQMDQRELADKSGVSIPTIKRMEARDGLIRATYGNVAAVVAVLEAAGIEFLDNDSPGVRMRPSVKPPKAASKAAATKTTKPRRPTRK